MPLLSFKTFFGLTLYSKHCKSSTQLMTQTYSPSPSSCPLLQAAPALQGIGLPSVDVFSEGACDGMASLTADLFTCSSHRTYIVHQLPTIFHRHIVIYIVYTSTNPAVFTNFRCFWLLLIILVPLIYGAQSFRLRSFSCTPSNRMQ